MHRPIHSIPEAGKALRKRDRLQVGDVAPETEKNIRRPTSCHATLPTPGPVATVDGARHPPRSGRRSARPGAPAPARPGPRGAAASEAARRPDSDYRFTRGAGRPAPAGAPSRGPAPPPAYSSPFMRTPSAAAAAASAAAVAVASRRIGWRPRRRHFPTARGACGSAAALQARPLARGQANRGVRGGAGRGGRPRAGVPPGLPGPRRLLPTGGGRQSPREPPPRRQAGAGPGAVAGFALAPSLVRAPPPSSCRSAERGAGLAEGRLLPGRRRPAPRRPRARPLHSSSSPGPWKGRSVGKGWLSFNRRQSVSGSVCAEPEPPAAESRRCCELLPARRADAARSPAQPA